MAETIEWITNEKRIRVVPPKNPKKITGTRLASILGLNPWSTPFEVWCAIMRVYEKPFEETIYTAAGKVIEPKQAEYAAQHYFWRIIKSPTDIFGENYFKKTRGDFYHDRTALGGMWDYLFVDKDGNPTGVLEMKTTKRAEDWEKDIPEYYALQAALYAYLLGVDDVFMVASFLEQNDYKDPSKFVCTTDNTIVRPFRVSERYPDFERVIQTAKRWWKKHVEGGISPIYDEAKDADILKELRTNSLTPDTDLSELIAEAEDLKAKLDEQYALIEGDEKRYKVVTDMLKQAAINQFRAGDERVFLEGKKYTWEVSKYTQSRVDTKALKDDGLYEKYSRSTDNYKLTQKERNEEDVH